MPLRIGKMTSFLSVLSTCQLLRARAKLLLIRSHMMHSPEQVEGTSESKHTTAWYCNTSRRGRHKIDCPDEPDALLGLFSCQENGVDSPCQAHRVSAQTAAALRCRVGGEGQRRSRRRRA